MPKVSSQRPPSKKKKKSQKKSSTNGKAKVSNQNLDVISSIMDVRDIQFGGIKIGIYGRSGTGKTRLACSFPKPLLLVRANEGARSVSKKSGIDATKLLTDADELRDVVRHVRSTDKYKTVVLDEITTYQDIILSGIKGWSLDYSNVDDKSMPQQLRWGDVTQSEWGEVSRELKGRVSELLALADHGTTVVVLAQEREYEQKNDSEYRLEIPNVMFALGPASAGWLAKEVDYACQTYIERHEVEEERKVGSQVVTEETEKTDYFLRIGPHPVYYTKFRFCEEEGDSPVRLPESIVDPTYGTLSEYLGE